MDQAELTLLASTGSPAAARRFVVDRLEAWGCGELGEVAALLTSELVTNAVVHAASAAAMTVSVEGPTVRVTVGDHDGRSVSPRKVAPTDTHGRGLFLVDALSRRWGVDQLPAGKEIWFELESSLGAVSSSSA